MTWVSRHWSLLTSLLSIVYSFTVNHIVQIEPAFDGNLGFDNARVSAFLVLAIAAPLCHGKNRCKIPAPIFSYAVTMLGKISCALADEVDQDALLAYLSHCSRGSTDPVTDCKEILCAANFNSQIFPDSEKNEVSKTDVQKMHSGNLLLSHAKVQLETDCRLLKSMNNILSKIESIWSSVKLGHVNEGLRTVRY